MSENVTTLPKTRRPKIKTSIDYAGRLVTVTPPGGTMESYDLPDHSDHRDNLALIGLRAELLHAADRAIAYKAILAGAAAKEPVPKPVKQLHPDRQAIAHALVAETAATPEPVALQDALKIAAALSRKDVGLHQHRHAVRDAHKRLFGAKDAEVPLSAALLAKPAAPVAEAAD